LRCSALAADVFDCGLDGCLGHGWKLALLTIKCKSVAHRSTQTIQIALLHG
jgi:hypothetical protein